MDALDLSNNTTRFTVDHVQRWKADGIQLAIVHLISGVHLAGDDCATQIRTCLDGELAVDCYIFPRNDGLPMGPAEKLALVPDDLQPKIRQLWADVETAFGRNPTREQVDEVLAAGDAWAPWQQTGTYSALWVADELHWHPWPWPDRKQWLVYVRYDGAPNLNGAFDGTNNHVMTQYRMDVVEAGVAGMDRNLLSDSEAQAVNDWLNGGDVRIPADYVSKFHLQDDQDIQGLIDNFEGTIRTAREIAFAEGQASGADAEAKLQRIKDVVNA